jgi:hypothetical protein
MQTPKVGTFLISPNSERLLEVAIGESIEEAAEGYEADEGRGRISPIGRLILARREIDLGSCPCLEPVAALSPVKSAAQVCLAAGQRAPPNPFSPSGISQRS